MKKFLSKASVLSFLVVLTFCDNNFFGTQLTRTSSLDPTGVEKTPRDTPPGGDSSLDYFDVTIEWTQPTEAGLVRPEIVFVLDRSGSMGGEVVALKSALQGWLTNLQSQGVENFCVGIMSSVVRADQTGRLQRAGSNPRCLCTDDGLTVAQISEKFGQNLDVSAQSTGGDDGGEAAFYSFNKALNDPDIFAFNQSEGCFRNTHTLAAIFLSDENDLSASINGAQDATCNGDTVSIGGDTYNIDAVTFDNSPFEFVNGSGEYTTSNPAANTYTPSEESSGDNCNEPKARLTYYSDLSVPAPYPLLISPQSIANDLIEYNGELPTFGSAVVYQQGENAFVVSGENGPGHGFFEFASELGQTTADLNVASTGTQAQFNTELNTIADALVEAVTFIRSFTLVNQNGDPLPVCEGQESTLKVRVNDNLVPSSKYTLSANRKKVTFKPSYTGFTLGAAVSAEYISCE